MEGKMLIRLQIFDKLNLVILNICVRDLRVPRKLDRANQKWAPTKQLRPQTKRTKSSNQLDAEFSCKYNQHL